MALESFNISKLSGGACLHTTLAAHPFDACVISLALKLFQFFHLKGSTVWVLSNLTNHL